VSVRTHAHTPKSDTLPREIPKTHVHIETLNLKVKYNRLGFCVKLYFVP